MTCAKLLFVLWNTGLLEALLISRPFFREIQFTVNQRMSFATDVSDAARSPDCKIGRPRLATYQARLIRFIGKLSSAFE